MSDDRRDPMRWMDGGDDAPTGFADAVRAEQSEVANAAQLARVLDGIAQQLARPELAQAYRAQQGEALHRAAQASTRSAWGVPLGVGALCASAAVWAWFALRAEPAPATPAATQRALPAAAAAPAAAAPAAPMPRAAAATPSEPPAPAAQAAAVAPPPSPARDRGAALQRARQPNPQAELALLEAAQRALASDPGRTLALSETHRRKFARPQFDQEREMLAIEALLRLGDSAQAQARARRFERTHPTSSHLPRLRTLLAAGGPAP